MHHAGLDWVTVGFVYSQFQEGWCTLTENMDWFGKGQNFSSTNCKCLTGNKFEELCMTVDCDKVAMRDNYNAPFNRKELIAVSNSIVVVKRWVSNLNTLLDIQNDIYHARMVELSRKFPNVEPTQTWKERNEVILRDICDSEEKIEKMLKKPPASKRSFDSKKAVIQTRVKRAKSFHRDH